MSLSSESKQIIVTIDGPAGSGKSTVARLVARRMKMDFLDTGAMYRGIAAAVLDAGLDPADEDVVADLAGKLHIRFSWADDPPRLKIDGCDVGHRLRDSDVTRAVSDIAGNKRVREILVRAQRWIGREHSRLVTEGRDQGSVVFKDARMKFYLDATPEIRAKRRADQLRQAGREVDEAKILEKIIYRDKRDTSRQDGPLVCPEGAARIDTSDMNIDQVVDTLCQYIQQAIESSAGQPVSGGGDKEQL